MGHVHVRVSDADLQKKFWVDILRAKPYQYKTLSGVHMPGIVILFINVKTKAEPSIGSSVNHIGVFVPKIADCFSKLDAAGLKYTKNANGLSAFVEDVDGLRVEINEDPAHGAMRFDHVQFFIPAPKEAQTWYAEKFGAVKSSQGTLDIATLPGATLKFTQADGTVPTRTRSLDHIGFDVKDLKGTIARLEAMGIKFDSGYRAVPDVDQAIAFLTDPWGTRIELTEGLDATVLKQIAH